LLTLFEAVVFGHGVNEDGGAAIFIILIDNNNTAV
jgi:hypothetical protein